MEIVILYIPESTNGFLGPQNDGPDGKVDTFKTYCSIFG